MERRELIEKARSTKSVEELLHLAKANNYPLDDEEAKRIFAEFHKSGELSDDELDAVAGGGCASEEGGQLTPVTKDCPCFTGLYQPGVIYSTGSAGTTCTVLRDDNTALREAWACDRQNTCGSCYHLDFVGGVGYCGKS